jgi:hypothetical protein
MGFCRLDWAGSGYRKVMDTCEKCNETLGFKSYENSFKD